MKRVFRLIMAVSIALGYAILAYFVAYGFAVAAAHAYPEVAETYGIVASVIVFVGISVSDFLRRTRDLPMHLR